METSSLSVAETRSLLHRLGLRAKKSLGQHFLIDRRVLQQIIMAAELAPDDIVIEIGPGLGVLTAGLAEKAGRTIAIEIDSKLASTLSQKVAHLPNVTIINADVLQVDPAMLVASGGNKGYKVVANLPYYTTSPVLRHFLEASLKPSRMVVMVQKEVGEAIVAQPGGLSLLAISVQFYGKPLIVDYVSAQCFYPSPKVDSVILRIDLYKQPPVEVPSITRFFETIRAGFGAPRKQLHNALAQGLGLLPPEAADLIGKAGINPRRRAETLNLQEWAKMCVVLTNYRSG